MSNSQQLHLFDENEPPNGSMVVKLDIQFNDINKRADFMAELEKLFFERRFITDMPNHLKTAVSIKCIHVTKSHHHSIPYVIYDYHEHAEEFKHVDDDLFE